jgi:branched-chain amino acid transport system ATP-binding protein
VSDPAPALLELRNVYASYGPYHALFGASLSVPEHCTVALVGSNGAGKSTVARVASGLVHSTSGSILLGGVDITRWPAWRIARAGVFHAPEGRSVFASLTVEENLVLGFRSGHGERQRSEALDRAYSIFHELAHRRAQLAGTLSGGEQRMLTLARVLAVPQHLVIVDELSLGLAPAAVEEVFGALARIREAGTSLLVADQHVERLLDLADRVVVLVRGRVVQEGAVSELSDVVSSLMPARAVSLGVPTNEGGQQPGGTPERPDAE